MHRLFRLGLEIKNDHLWFIDILADSKLQGKLFRSCSIGAFFKALKHNIGTGPDAGLGDYIDFVYDGVMEQFKKDGTLETHKGMYKRVQVMKDMLKKELVKDDTIKKL